MKMRGQGMSEEIIMSIIDLSLLQALNPDYQPEGEKREFCIWIQTNNERDFESVKGILSTPWDKIKPVKGICIKVLPLFFTPEQVDWVKSNWEGLPIDTKELLEAPPERGFTSTEEYIEWRKLESKERIEDNAEDRNQIAK
jgi:hypothetical protein